MSQNQSRAYLVTECHPNLDDFAGMTKEMQSDLLWDWSVFREDKLRDQEKTEASNSRLGSDSKQEHILGDLLRHAAIFPLTRRVFFEKVMPALVTTHMVSVIIGVVIGRRLCASPQNRR